MAVQKTVGINNGTASLLYLKQIQEHAVVEGQSSEWCAGFVGTCLDAESSASDLDGLWKPVRPFIISWPMVAETKQGKTPITQANLSAGMYAGQISLGVVALLFDDQEFFNGMEGGLEHCFSLSICNRSVWTQELHRMLAQTMIEEGQGEHGEKLSSTAFRAGFTFGWIMGRLHPNLNNIDEGLTWIWALEMKYIGRCPAL
jgi:hypothetical protein